MANYKVNSRLSKTVKLKLKEAVIDLNKNKFLKGFTKLIVDEIRSSAQAPGGRKYPPLKEGTIKGRKRLAKTNKTHSAYSPSKPNLTFTGQFLDSIRTRLSVKAHSLLFKINVSGSHKPYKNSKGKTRKVTFLNEKTGKESTRQVTVPNKVIREGMIKIKRDPFEGFYEGYKNTILAYIGNNIKKRLK